MVGRKLYDIDRKGNDRGRKYRDAGSEDISQTTFRSALVALEHPETMYLGQCHGNEYDIMNAFCKNHIRKSNVELFSARRERGIKKTRENVT